MRRIVIEKPRENRIQRTCKFIGEVDAIISRMPKGLKSINAKLDLNKAEIVEDFVLNAIGSTLAAYEINGVKYTNMEILKEDWKGLREDLLAAVFDEDDINSYLEEKKDEIKENMETDESISIEDEIENEINEKYNEEISELQDHKQKLEDQLEELEDEISEEDDEETIEGLTKKRNSIEEKIEELDNLIVEKEDEIESEKEKLVKIEINNLIEEKIDEQSYDMVQEFFENVLNRFSVNYDYLEIMEKGFAEELKSRLSLALKYIPNNGVDIDMDLINYFSAISHCNANDYANINNISLMQHIDNQYIVNQYKRINSIELLYKIKSNINKIKLIKGNDVFVKCELHELREVIKNNDLDLNKDERKILGIKSLDVILLELEDLLKN